jgi:hypothetical protein
MTQVVPNTDVVSMEMVDLWIKVEDAMADGVVTDQEKKGLRIIYRLLQLKARVTALMQRVGLSIARLGRLDKNLVTEMRSLCNQQEALWRDGVALEVVGEQMALPNDTHEKAATGWTLEAALEMETTLLSA